MDRQLDTAKSTRKSYGAWLIALMAPATANSLIPFAKYEAVSSYGPGLLVDLAIDLTGLAFIAVCFAALFGAYMSFSKTTRRIGFLLLALPVIWFASFVAFMNLGENIRMRAFANLADRSTELVQAIERYTDQHAEPPGELSDLVPVFVSEIPKTGMAAYPEYEYYVGEDANRYDGNPWVLLVSTPLWGINWDQFMYFPLRNYPEKGYGGVLERLGSWAYVHE